MSRVVAIDGPAGSGKSTLAARLALALDLPYVNTGTTYRAVAREALRRGVSPDDGPALAAIAERIDFTVDEHTAPARMFVDGAPPGDELRTPGVEAVVSRVSRHPEVREVLRSVQRRLGAGGAVVEGRDIGTVVFPDATVKIFLEAGLEERSARRHAELGDLELAEAVGKRDALDRQVNPFIPAPDALVVNTSGRTADETFEQVIAEVRERLGDAGG